MPKFVKCEDAISFANEVSAELTGKDREDFGFYSMLGDISISLVNYRAEYGLTQDQLAERLSVSQAMISKYENGNYNFSLQTLNHVCHVLGLRLAVSVKPKEDWQIIPCGNLAEEAGSEAEDNALDCIDCIV